MTITRKAWAQEDDALLIQLKHKGMNNEEAGKIIGRTKSAVKNRVQILTEFGAELGLQTKRRWTDKEVDTLIDMTKNGFSYAQIGETLGRTKKAVEIKHSNLFGVRSSEIKVYSPTEQQEIEYTQPDANIGKISLFNELNAKVTTLQRELAHQGEITRTQIKSGIYIDEHIDAQRNFNHDLEKQYKAVKCENRWLVCLGIINFIGLAVVALADYL